MTRYHTAKDRRGMTAEEELRALRGKLEELMSERVGPALGAVAGQAEAVALAATDQVREKADRLSARVQARPLAAVAVAAAAGFALAALLRR